jgi:hypothetical protein
MSQLPSNLPFGFVETDVPRHRVRGWIFFAIFVIIVIVAAVAVDNFARGFIEKQIETKARSALTLTDATPVSVKVGGFSAIVQAISGRFDQVDVSIAKLAVGDLSGKAVLSANGVPIKSDQKIDSAKVVFIADQAQVLKLLSGFTTLPLKSVKIGSGAVQIGTEATVLNISVPIAISFVPSVVDGQLALTPKSLVVNNATLTPAALKKTFGAIADPLVATQKICVAKYLPKDLPLDSITVKGSTLQLAVAGKSLALNSTLLTTKGVCA